MSLAHATSFAPSTAVAPTAAASAPRLRAVPEGTEARGFVLYVGIDDVKAAAAGTNLGAIVAGAQGPRS